MTVADLRCDSCERYLSGPGIDGATESDAVRLLFHPGDARFKDDSTLLCRGCWARIEAELGEAERPDVCARCGARVGRDDSLHLSRILGGPGLWPTWQLCRTHTVEFLNGLRTTDPPLTDETLYLRKDFGRGLSRG